MRRLYLIPLLCCWILCMSQVSAQKPKRFNSADIHDAIKKLQVLGSALYLAAHPDDENTAMIAYLANHKRINTAYLSLTRGDGGQNRIGPEIRELLGVIRTQELLQARSVDGGQQFFSRANDFGYSKNAKEALNIWDKEAVLADVVWAIRKFQPDVIINRFPHDSDYPTHGHHTASAKLSYEAFDLVGDPKAFPEQLQYLSTWQPRRLFFNSFWKAYGSQANFDALDPAKMVSIDAGVYYPLKGKSNTEIAAESRSMHQCQGFGTTGTRGSKIEYLELLKGDLPKDREDIFAGINTSWTRVEGGAPIGQLIQQIDKNFDYENPSASIPTLVKAYQLIQALPAGYWKRVKLVEIKTVIKACTGLYLEAVADDHSATIGQKLSLSIEAVNRSTVPMVLEKVRYLPLDLDSSLQLNLASNQAFHWETQFTIPTTLSSSNPYWLNQTGTLGMYHVPEQTMRGLPETPRALTVQYNLEIAGTKIDFTIPIIYKKNDPVKGESYRPFEITLPISANIQDQVYVFADEQAKEVVVAIQAGRDQVAGTLSLEHPKGWRVEPTEVAFNLQFKAEKKLIRFKVFPPKDQHTGKITAQLFCDGIRYNQSLTDINYEHIPHQMVWQPASAKVVKVDLKKAGKNIGYVMGAGDLIPASLAQIGYQVSLLDEADMQLTTLQQYDAIILGVRALNTLERMKFHLPKLLAYTKEGGTLIVQYNTNHRLKVEEVGPYPLTLSRDRVTVEGAEVRFLKKEHLVLNWPNKITTADFDHWVQERGLYFPNEWDPRFEAILSANDPDEPPRDGGLLVAKYGKGHYIYTGYSWFRELPAGVPGAYRIFSNLISIGQYKRP
ncbi:MAG: PIG-L family deacetylase [Saprospiraceae bacterium]